MRSKDESVEHDSSSSLSRGLSVLQCFGKDKRNRYTLSELAKRLSMPKPSIYRILKTFSRMGYLRYEEHSKHYHHGVRLLKMDYAPKLMKIGSHLSEALGTEDRNTYLECLSWREPRRNTKSIHWTS